MNKLKQLYQKLTANPNAVEAIAYLIFGVLTTLVNWAVYFGLTALLVKGEGGQDALWLNLSNAVAWVLSVLFAYVTNKRYVFKSTAKHAAAGRELLLFFTARLGSYFLFDVGLYNLLVVVFSLHHAPVKIVANVCVVAFNYVASKWGILKKGQ